MTLTLPVCRHRGDELPSGRFPCASPLLNVPAGGVSAELCRRCPLADQLPRGDRSRPEIAASTTVLRAKIAGATHCAHRGDVVARRPADLCGLRGTLYDVHACRIHGECVTRRTCRKQQERFCPTCDDWQTPAPAPAD